MEAVIGSPGTPNRIEVMLPVVAVTAAIPRRKEKASTGLIWKIKGSIRARVTGPPRPGRIPTRKPMAIPANCRTNAFQVKSWIRPWREASRISAIGGFQRARGSRRAPQVMDGSPLLRLFLAAGDQKLCQFGFEFRIEVVKAGHQLCHSGSINRIDVHLGFFRFLQELRIAKRFHKGLLQKLKTILRN